ncbi:MAG: allantoinase [Rhodothermales bacterium]|jgi:allantoinase
MADFDLTVHGDLALPSGVLRSGWMGIRAGRIAAIGAEPLLGRAHVDVGDQLVLPGFVDAHVHTRSNPKEGITAATRSAAAGGTTTIIDMPFDRPSRPVRTAEALRTKIDDVNRDAIVNVALWATFPPSGPLTQIAALAEAGAAGFKASTVHVDDDRFPRVPDGQLVAAFRLIAETGLPAAAHQENQDIVDRAAAAILAQRRPVPVDHARSRPPVAETEATGRLLEFAHATGARVHIVHGTVPRTFDLINWHRSTGVKATGETCLQYLLLDESAFEVLGSRAKCNPPLRTPEAAEALWLMLADGRIDIVTSDHSPYPPAVKDKDNVFDAWAGLSGAESLGTLLYSEGVAKGRLSLDRFLEVLCSGPADIYGLANKGRLAVGRDADFAVLDPAADWTMDENRLQCPSGWSAYQGRPVRGRVSGTWVAGRQVFDGDSVVGPPGSGSFVRPSN